MLLQIRSQSSQRSPFDYVVAILPGATLRHVIVGASPAIPTLVASLVIVLRHRALTSTVVGAEREVYRCSHFNDEQMSATLITKTDVFQTARQEFHTLDLEQVQSAILERNGQVSLIRKRSNSDA